MGIFKYRNLALGCLGFIICLFASYYMSTVLRIVFLSTVLLLYLGIAIYCLVKRGEKNKNLLARITPLALLIAIAFSISLLVFTTNESKATELRGKEGVIEARVEEVLYESSYLGIYEINIISIDKEEVNAKAIGEIQFASLKYGDVFEAEAYISSLDEKSLGFDEAEIYQDRGIFLRVEAEKHRLISNNANNSLLWLKDLNETLSSRFYKGLSKETASLLSALLLGNTKGLDPSVKRDFTRLGVTHVLALSGMHLAIVSAILTFLLKLVGIKRRISYVLTCVGIFFFTAMTGFLVSCLRAALMLIIFNILRCFGKRTDTITLLFLSVTIICIVSPYSIFSMSLQLSFLAMMGCVLSTRIIYAIKFLRRLPFKPLRYVVFSLITTIVITLATIPVLSVKIGGIAILSPIINIILVPIFNLLIYISPIYLAICNVPYLSNFVGGVCEFLCKKSIQLVSFFANLKGIVVPTSNWIQILGIVICVGGLILLILTNKKLRVKIVSVILCGLCFIIAGTVVVFVDRNVNAYAGAYSESTRDLVYFEESNQLSIIDMSPSTTGVANTASALASYLGYFEIENYIITDLSSASDKFFQRLTSNTKVRSVYLPAGVSEKEVEARENILAIAQNEGVNIYDLQEYQSIGNVSLDIRISDAIARSERKCTYFNLTIDKCSLVYLAPSCYELTDTTPEKWAYQGDVLIFGSYGPPYHMEYNYEAPYAQTCMFLGESKRYASVWLIADLPRDLNTSAPVRLRIGK